MGNNITTNNKCDYYYLQNSKTYLFKHFQLLSIILQIKINFTQL